jgi:peptide/nickel transport system substrate-binding protein
MFMSAVGKSAIALLGSVLLAAAGQSAAVRRGGVLVVAQVSEPKTLNPVLAADQPTRDIHSLLSADLVHINRRTLRTELALASSCIVSADGRHYTVTLRDGLRFSDGAPLTADDVVFTFAVYLDARVNSPQRDLLLVDGRPITVTKLTTTSVRVDLPAPYAPGERLFDSFWILPRHKLERAYAAGRLTQAWTLGTPPADMATPGPFVLKQYAPGERLVFERNPYYWKHDEAGAALPYLDRIEVVFAADQSAQMLRLLSHDVSAAGRLRAEDVPKLQQAPFLAVRDAGPGLEYNFLFFNWNASGPRGDWFRSLKFRQAVAHAIDRDAIVRLAYQNRGSAIWSQVTPGNPLWRTEALTKYPYDPARAEQLLREGGFRRTGDSLVDRDGRTVEFSILMSASNQPRRRMATIVQEDLERIGMRVRLAPMDFGAMMDAVLQTRKFDAALWGMASGDADPNSEMNVWSSGGTLHIWNLKAPSAPAPRLEPWESEVDRLMTAQMTEMKVPARKAAYDRVQLLVSANLPLVFLASPHIMAAADKALGNFEPAAVDPVLLWNADRLFWTAPR